jgi:hypothetical protein
MIHISLQVAPNICLWQKSHSTCLQSADEFDISGYVADNGVDSRWMKEWQGANSPTTLAPASYFFRGGKVFGS